MVDEQRLEAIGIRNWADLSRYYAGADLLLGNGFSLKLTGHFAYKSLFEDFLSRCTPKDKSTFQRFGTSHFELLQEMLLNAKKVNTIFDIVTDNRIDDALGLLKNGLINSIQSNHPQTNQIDWMQLQRLSKQLNRFGDIYTLNYDLFLYHIIMQMIDKSRKEGVIAPYSDFFWGEYNEEFKQFMDSDCHHRNYVYYLHGALFIFKLPPDTCKIRRGDNKEELVAMIGEMIEEKGIMPLFVSEGKSKEKLKAIERSNYLSSCYENLENSKGKLVIFGSSLSDQDSHIVKAINYQKNKRELAIAIHIGIKSEKELRREMAHFTDQLFTHSPVFFDSETIFNF